VVGKYGVGLRTLDRVVGELERPLHRLREPIAVVPKRMCAADLQPEQRCLAAFGHECDRALEEVDRVVELVSGLRRFGCAI
jgi:hypothetical protein